MPTQKKYTVLFIATGTVCILALYLQMHRHGLTSRLDGFIVSFTGTFQKQFLYMGHGAHTVVDHYISLVNAKKRNEELQKENSELRTQVASLKDVELENTRLRNALSFREKLKQTLLAAHVVANDVSVDYVGIRIDKGSKDGVHPGMGIVSPGGLVGIVRFVTDRYADIVTLVDPTSNIDVIIERSRARGILSGQNKQLTCRMKYVDRLEDVTVGDVVVSTDFGGVFPRGLLVGYVTSVIPNSNGILQSVIIRPAVDVFRLEEVFVVVPQSESKENTK